MPKYVFFRNHGVQDVALVLQYYSLFLFCFSRRYLDYKIIQIWGGMCCDITVVFKPTLIVWTRNNKLRVLVRNTNLRYFADLVFRQKRLNPLQLILVWKNIPA